MDISFVYYFKVKKKKEKWRIRPILLLGKSNLNSKDLVAEARKRWSSKQVCLMLPQKIGNLGQWTRESKTH